MRVFFHRFWYMISCLLLCIVAVFSAMMSAKLSVVFQFALFILMLFSAMLANMEGPKLKIVNRIPVPYGLLIIYCIFAVIGFNGNRFGSLRIVACLIFIFLLMREYEWISIAKHALAVVTGLNVVATYFFYLFPRFYSVMIRIYGYIPAGTSGGKAGYRAGIANHYSQNGIYLSVFVLLLCVILLEKQSRLQGKEKFLRNNIGFVITIVVSFSALLLTGKRGVLIWLICAFVFTCFAVSKKKIGTIMKMGMVLLVGIGLLQVLIEIVPEVSFVFQRFETAGSDMSSTGRFAMWKLAWNEFKKNPIFGNGFWSYRSAYERELSRVLSATTTRYTKLDAHNVYIQVLCETGIVGEMLYLLAVGSIFKKTFGIVRKIEALENPELRFGILLSLCIQTFYLLYSLSGNCLYDIVFYFYALAVALCFAVDRNLQINKQDSVANVHGGT